MKKILSLMLCLVFLCSLTACGANSSATMKSEAMFAAGPVAPAEAAAMDAASNNLSGTTGSTALPENRKWIITIDMNVETDDLDTMLQNLDSQILSLNGYVENQSIYNGSTYSDRRYRNANLTVRIPAENVDLFTEEVTVYL